MLGGGMLPHKNVIGMMKGEEGLETKKDVSIKIPIYMIPSKDHDEMLMLGPQQAPNPGFMMNMMSLGGFLNSHYNTKIEFEVRSGEKLSKEQMEGCRERIKEYFVHEMLPVEYTYVATNAMIRSIFTHMYNPAGSGGGLFPGWMTWLIAATSGYSIYQSAAEGNMFNVAGSSVFLGGLIGSRLWYSTKRGKKNMGKRMYRQLDEMEAFDEPLDGIKNMIENYIEKDKFEVSNVISSKIGELEKIIDNADNAYDAFQEAEDKSIMLGMPDCIKMTYNLKKQREQQIIEEPVYGPISAKARRRCD